VGLDAGGREDRVDLHCVSMSAISMRYSLRADLARRGGVVDEVVADRARGDPHARTP